VAALRCCVRCSSSADGALHVGSCVSQADGNRRSNYDGCLLPPVFIGPGDPYDKHFGHSLRDFYAGKRIGGMVRDIVRASASTVASFSVPSWFTATTVDGVPLVHRCVSAVGSGATRVL
jgi:hypothetical protein